jgi:hypothetical protein
MPPGDIPYEASDTLAFTPECLKDLPDAPVFTLRAITSREKRHQRRMALKHMVTHSEPQVRQIIREELAAVWGAEHCAKFLPHLEEYWSALDEWRLQVADDPEIGDFTYDPQMRAAINKLLDEMRLNSDRYADALADNADAGEIAPLLMVAVTVESVTGLDTTAQPEKGYFTYAGIEAVQNALAKVAKAAGATESAAFMELLLACGQRWRLPEEELGNSASPLPSEPDPESSSDATASSDHGTSPASVKSRKKTSAA